MKIKFLVTAILFSSCLTSWAWFPKAITQEKIDQIRIGQTTEADLVELFGPPTTRMSDLSHSIALDWFRSVPMPPSGYLPIVGQFLGGLNLEAQQLSVVLSPGGRVVRYEMHSSKDKPRGEGLRMAAVQEIHPSK
jgi:hypothetical protein